MSVTVRSDRPSLGLAAARRRILTEAVGRGLAALLLIAAAPLLLALFCLVRLTSGGPALHGQLRVGHRGRLFVMYKFRTMHQGAETVRDALLCRNEFVDGPLFKLREDPRVTPVGRWLRRWSLDELPQLWNVVRGDMALIGPRPPLPLEVAAYTPRERRRLLVKPGLTGLWQVCGRCELSWAESVRLDLEYVDHWRPSLDVVILARTVVAVLSRRGAY